MAKLTFSFENTDKTVISNSVEIDDSNIPRIIAAYTAIFSGSGNLGINIKPTPTLSDITALVAQRSLGDILRVVHEFERNEAMKSVEIIPVTPI